MVGSLVPRPSNPPVDLTIRDFKSDRALGRSSLISQLADAAAEQICGLYGKSPSSIVRTIPFGSGTIDNSRPILSDLCENIAPLPPLPAPPFSGGQCPVAYDVNVAVSAHVINNGQTQPANSSASTICVGPVTSVFTRDVGQAVSSGDPSGRLVQIIAFCQGSNNPISFPGTPPGQQAALVGGSQPFAYDSHTVSVVRRDGQPDSCGSLPPDYPPPSATVDDLDGTTVINLPGSNVTVPVRVVPTFAPTANIFKPEFNVNVGGINVNISAGGFTFSPTVQIQPNVNFPVNDPRPSPPPPLAISPPSSAPSAPTDLTPVITKLDELLAREIDCCVPEEPAIDDPKYIRKTVSSESLESGEVFLPDGTYRVRMLMTQISANPKKQLGAPGATVYFAGSAWFSSGFSLGERLPIDAQNKQFIPYDKSQNAFVWSYNVGYKGLCTVYYRELR